MMLIPLDPEQRTRILARYNDEVAHGIVHTAEWRAQMAMLQREWDAAQEAKRIAEGYTKTESGWLKLIPPYTD